MEDNPKARHHSWQTQPQSQVGRKQINETTRRSACTQQINHQTYAINNTNGSLAEPMSWGAWMQCTHGRDHVQTNELHLGSSRVASVRNRVMPQLKTQCMLVIWTDAVRSRATCSASLLVPKESTTAT
jgi:hypothetical protein